MILPFERAKLEDITKLLVATAMGKKKADLVIKDGTLVNVNSRELLENGMSLSRMVESPWWERQTTR